MTDAYLMIKCRLKYISRGTISLNTFCLMSVSQMPLVICSGALKARWKRRYGSFPLSHTTQQEI